jgi:anti-sigma factor RsiW
MDHPSPSELLAHAAGLLESDAAARIGEHLRTCPSCMRERAVQRSIDDAARRALDLRMRPEALDALIGDLLPHMPAGKRVRRFGFVSGGIEDAVFIVTIAALLLLVSTVEPGGQSGIAGRILTPVSSLLGPWLDALVSSLNGMLQPLRFRIEGDTASMLLLVLPALLVLHFVDRVFSRLLHRHGSL